MEKVLVEPFTLNDLEIIAKNLEKDYDNFWNYNILKNELLNSASIYLCCKVDNKIVGFAGITIILDIAELNNIVIKKDYRGNGLSSILLKKLIDIAKSKNCKQFNLEVSCLNQPAIKLYKKFGFNQVGIRPKYYNGINGILLSLEL